MAQYKSAGNLFYDDPKDTNSVIAKELSRIQAIYQFYTYKNNGAIFSNDKIKNREKERNYINTSIGRNILKLLIDDNI